MNRWLRIYEGHIFELRIKTYIAGSTVQLFSLQEMKDEDHGKKYIPKYYLQTPVTEAFFGHSGDSSFLPWWIFHKLDFFIKILGNGNKNQFK